ncbi:MAG: calcium/sodium antiporter [Longimicrobiales bacterium]
MGAIGLVILGLLLLAVGGEVLVRGATRVARIAGLTPAVIGLTVVALGTSLPELVVSVSAAAQDRASLAIANVVGSNILNITGTLGLVALITPLPARTTLVRLEWPALLLASAAALLVMRDGVVDRYEGSSFVIALVVFTAYSVYIARREATQQEQVSLAKQADAHAPGQPRGIAYSLALLALGLSMLIVGGDLLVDGAVRMARSLGVSERRIGLTVVAIGTGAPEIAATLAAALRKHTDIAMGNLIGSNIFNVLGILGVAALWRPLRFESTLVAYDAWWMLGTALLLLPVILIGARVTRAEGALLLGIYVTYLATITR